MSPLQVPPPPEPFDPAIDILNESTLLYRVHSVKFAAEQFNPGLDEWTQASRQGDIFPVGRFSFFLDDPSDPEPVPVLYAAAGDNAAIWEVILRDRDALNQDPVPPSAYAHRMLSCIRPTRELRVGSLAGADMRRFRMNQTDLIDPEPKDYHQTIPWARAAWASGLDGIKYVAKRDLSSVAYVFFEPRGDEPAMFAPAPDANPPKVFGDYLDGFEWLNRRMNRWGLQLDR